jgi:hypothetical protein
MLTSLLGNAELVVEVVVLKNESNQRMLQNDWMPILV